MKCFVLLCVLAVVGVRARPSAEVNQSAKNAISGDVKKLKDLLSDVDVQDTDWDAVLGHITGIAGDIKNNAKAILPTIISILGGIGKRDLPADIDVQDFDLEDITGVLAKISSAWSKIVTGAAPVINQIPFGSIGKRDVESEDIDIGAVISQIVGDLFGKRDEPQVEIQDFDLDKVLDHIVGIANDISKNVQQLMPTIIKVVEKMNKPKRDELPVDLQDTDWDAVLGHITGIAGDIQNNAKAILPTIISILGGIGKRDLPADIDVQDFDLEDITGVLAKISSAWSKIVTGAAPVINLIPFGSIGKRDVESEDIDIGAVISQIVGDLVGKRGLPADVDVQDFDLEDITGVLAKISSAWSKIVTGAAPVINLIPFGSIGKRDVESEEIDIGAVISLIVGDLVGKRGLPADVEVQNFDLEDITGVLAKISSAWSKIVTGAAPVINQIPFGSIGKRDVESEDIDVEDLLTKIFGGLIG